MKQTILLSQVFLMVLWQLMLSLVVLGQTGQTSYYTTELYSVESGISHAHVYRTFQDSRGFLWLVTGNGLNVFDGNLSTMVLSCPDLPGSEEVEFRAEDRHGRLWIEKREGATTSLMAIDLCTRKPKEIAGIFDQDKVGAVKDVSVDAGGRTLVVNAQGEVWREDETDDWTLLSKTMQGQWKFCTHQFSTDTIWVYSRNIAIGQNFWDTSFKAIRPFGRQYENIVIPNVRHFELLRDGVLWYMGKSETGLIQADKVIAKRPVESIYPKIDPIACRVERSSANNVLWVYQAGKLFKLTFSNVRQTLEVTCTQKADINEHGFHLYSGAKGPLFLSTNKGLVIIRSAVDPFQKLLWQKDAVNGGINLKEVRGICEGKDGKIYFQAGDWVYSYLPSSATLQKILPTLGGMSALLCDRAGMIWMAYGGDLVRYNPVDQTFERYPFPPELYFQHAWSMHDMGDSILVGLNQHLQFFQKKKKRFQNALTPFGKKELPVDGIYHIYPENDRDFWLCTNEGLYHLQSGIGKMTVYGNQQPENQFLPANYFRHLSRSADGTFLLATSTGLIQWKPLTETFKTFGTEASGSHVVLQMNNSTRHSLINRE